MLTVALATMGGCGVSEAEQLEKWQQEWPRTDFSRHTVDLGEILSGGPFKDGIPAIDRPQFVDIRTGSSWMRAREPVIVVVIGSDARAYPLQIMTYHEIVNDVVGGRAVAITFCPLCHAALAFVRKLDDRLLSFGTTGQLRFADLVMYDRQTESWWQQFTGEAIVGQLAGRKLEPLPSQIIAFEEFAAAHPRGLVLSRQTGFERPYGRNPYPGYDSADATPSLFKGKDDRRIPPMERVLGAHVAGEYRLYRLSTLARTPVMNDTVGDQPIVVFTGSGALSALDAGRIADSRSAPSAAAFYRALDGRIVTFVSREGTIRDEETGSRWNALGEAVNGPLAGKRLRGVDGGVHFAFAWLAFVPDAGIYGRDVATRASQ